MRQKNRVSIVVAAILLVTLALITGPAFAAGKKPNIVFIWGDDIGQSDISTPSLNVFCL